MHSLYKEVSNSTKQVLYQFMKDEDLSVLNYHFSSFFTHCIKENHIKVASHHFSNKKDRRINYSWFIRYYFFLWKRKLESKTELYTLSWIGTLHFKTWWKLFYEVSRQSRKVDRERSQYLFCCNFNARYRFTIQALL